MERWPLRRLWGGWKTEEVLQLRLSWTFSAPRLMILISWIRGWVARAGQHRQNHSVEEGALGRDGWLGKLTMGTILLAAKAWPSTPCKSDKIKTQGYTLT